MSLLPCGFNNYKAFPSPNLKVAVAVFNGGSRTSDEGGPGHPDPEIRGGPALKKLF